MSPQRYEPVSSHRTLSPSNHASRSNSKQQIQAHEDDDTPITPTSNLQPIPNSPPPSFRSRNSSPASRHILSEDPLADEADQTLADTFDDGNESDNEDDNGDDRQRLMRGSPMLSGESETPPPSTNSGRPAPQIVRRVTEFPGVTAPTRAGPRPVNDGVFANLAAKPERGEKVEEQPPVSRAITSSLTSLTNFLFRPTNKQLPMPPHRIGKLL